jgi:hypothetical protein
MVWRMSMLIVLEVMAFLLLVAFKRQRQQQPDGFIPAAKLKGVASWQ